jgi:hypothetical protein
MQTVGANLGGACESPRAGGASTPPLTRGVRHGPGEPPALAGGWGRRLRGHLRRCVCLLTCAFFLSAAAADGPVNPDDPAYLRRQYAWFRAQDPARQQQFRRLHAELTTLLPDEQARLTKVMQAYNAWLAKLPEADRQRVLAAPTAAERLEEIKRLRERDWVDGLPKVYRDEYARLDDEARRQKVQEWRAEEAERRDEWAIAQKHWNENVGRVPGPFANERAAIETFADHLRENLSATERKELNDARLAADEYGNFLGYAIAIARLSDQHPIFPWKTVGPREWRDLPEEVRRNLQASDKRFKNPKKLAALPGEGRWPEFAVEIAAACKKHDIKAPPLGECRKGDMPPDVIEAINRLEKDLNPKKLDPGRAADLKALEEAQGKWPDYPKLVAELARKYNKGPLPGWTLPGPPQFWERLRAGRKGKPGV